MGGQGGIERILTGPGGGGEGGSLPFELIRILGGSPWGVWTDGSPALTMSGRLLLSWHPSWFPPLAVEDSAKR